MEFILLVETGDDAHTFIRCDTLHKAYNAMDVMKKDPNVEHLEIIRCSNIAHWANPNCSPENATHTD